MKIRLYSESKEGKWAGLLMLIFIAIMAFKIFVRFPLPTPVIAVMGVVGSALGLLSVMKYKDRSILTWLSILMGLLIIVWTAAELVSPH